MTSAQSEVFGAEMKRRREGAGMSTKEFASYVGISQAYVCNLESANRKPSPQLAERIAESFGVKVSDMLIPHSEREQEARVRFGKALAKHRAEKGYSMSLVAGALGIPVAVYKEYEQGLCSIPERNIDTLHKLLVADNKPQAEEPKPEVTEDKATAVPMEICNIILEHVTDLKVDKDVQKELWRYFSKIKLDAEERRLFG